MESRIDPASPAYDERFASSIDCLRLRSPFEFEVALFRTLRRGSSCCFVFP